MWRTAKSHTYPNQDFRFVVLTLRIIVFRIPSTPYLKPISYTTRHSITLLFYTTHENIRIYLCRPARWDVFIHPDKCQKMSKGPYSSRTNIPKWNSFAKQFFSNLMVQIYIYAERELKLRLFACVILNNWIVFICLLCVRIVCCLVFFYGWYIISWYDERERGY